jgi:hypothetical protein
MITALIHSRDWAVVQADMGEILFLERGAGNDSIIARYQLDLLANPPPLPSPPDGRKFGFFDRAEVPYGSIWWTMIYQRMGRADLAARALEPALNYRPVKKGIENWLKDLQMKMGEIPSKP